MASIKANIAIMLSPRNLLFSLPVLALLLYYWIIPPLNVDSAAYHYSTILWYEKYKVVPGLGNVHGRFAFNTVSFIIQAAYSFTGLAGQSLYPLNGVLISMFMLWLLNRALRCKNNFNGLLYFIIFMLLGRTLLFNISSPSSDPLFIVCLCYAFIKLLDMLLSKNIEVSAVILPLILLLYTITAKLAALPALLMLPFALYLLRKKIKTLGTVFKLAVICLPIYIPWLCRNVILSGYLIYPLSFIDIFNVDWKAPKNVLAVDYIYIKNFSKLFSFDMAYVKTLPLNIWFFKWMHAQLNPLRLPDFATFLIALISPVYWGIVYIKNKKLPTAILIFWAITYGCVWFWVVNSPEYRFGITYLSFAFAIPFLVMAFTSTGKVNYVMQTILAVSIFAVAVWGVNYARHKKGMYPFTFKNYWLYPLTDKQYCYNNNLATFQYSQLGNGIKLYYEDTSHSCINAALPCMIWNYGTIEMRGNKIEDGFRNTKDEVEKYYPFVK